MHAKPSGLCKKVHLASCDWLFLDPPEICEDGSDLLNEIFFRRFKK